MKRILQKSFATFLAVVMFITPAAALTPDETLQLLDENYLGKIPDAVRDLDTTEEILAALGDPYTIYFPPVEYKDFISQVNGGSVVGIGVQIHYVQDKGIEIISVLPNSPAEEFGLVAGDCIAQINNITPTSNEHAQSLIGGIEGSVVSLTIRHANATYSSATLIRRAVDIPIVTIEDINGVPMINCVSFGATTADGVRDFLTEYFHQESPFLMDLRQNPGGTDAAVAGAAGAFIGGAPICYYLSNTGNVSYISTLSFTFDFTDQPLIILTSEHSASGSEMFCGVIRDYDAGIAIGSRTYGKGVGQRIFDATTHPDFFEDDSIKITTTRFYSPDGATNDMVGVFPSLTIAPEYVEDVAYLLSAPTPEDLTTCLKLDIGETSLYINIETATSERYLPAFAELMSALPITATLSTRHDNCWTPSSSSMIANDLGVSFQSRYYSDAANSPYLHQLDELATHYVLPTGENNTLNPTETLTRGDFAYLLAYALHLHVAEGNPFADVPSDDPNLKAIAALYAKNIICGDGNGNFNPDRLITVQEANVMLSSCAQWLCLEGFLTKSNGIDDETMAKYTAYAPWAREQIAVLDSFDGLLAGTTPTATVQRDQAGAMIHQLLDAAGILWN